MLCKWTSKYLRNLGSAFYTTYSRSAAFIAVLVRGRRTVYWDDLTMLAFSLTAWEQGQSYPSSWRKHGTNHPFLLYPCCIFILGICIAVPEARWNLRKDLLLHPISPSRDIFIEILDIYVCHVNTSLKACQNHVSEINKPPLFFTSIFLEFHLGMHPDILIRIGPHILFHLVMLLSSHPQTMIETILSCP